MYENILITGGAGFVGSALAIALRARMEPRPRVMALDNLHRRGSELNLERLHGCGVEFVHGDIRCCEDLANVPGRPNLIVECSAEPSAQAGYGHSPEYLVSANLVGCFHCLEAARRWKADFIFVSTSRVYPFDRLNQLRSWEDETRFQLLPDQVLAGASNRGVAEQFPLEGPRSLYGMTKLAAELMVEEYGNAYGISYIIDRCGLLTGPGQMAKLDQGVVGLWMAAHYFRRDLVYIGFGGSGKQVRDFLHVDDFCDLMLDQIRNFPAYSGQRFNVGGGSEHSVSLRELTALCQEITGNVVPISARIENRPADVRIYISDRSRVSSIRGWEPRRDARATLGDILRWIRGNEQRLEPLFFNVGNPAA